MPDDMPEQIDSSQLAAAVSKLSEPKGEQLTDLFDNMQITVMGRTEEEKSEASFVSDEESGDDITESHFQEDENKISQKHVKHTDIEERDREDMDFPDEVDTPLKEARKRFQKYRGIKSLKNCDWDPYENLPVEYSKIFRFENVQAELKKQREITENEGLPINGTYLTIVLEV
jgi:pre-rRNA-processing protein TSR1